jgi:hypothetical protein
MHKTRAFSSSNKLTVILLTTCSEEPDTGPYPVPNEISLRHLPSYSFKNNYRVIL